MCLLADAARAQPADDVPVTLPERHEEFRDREASQAYELENDFDLRPFEPRTATWLSWRLAFGVLDPVAGGGDAAFAFETSVGPRVFVRSRGPVHFLVSAELGYSHLRVSNDANRMFALVGAGFSGSYFGVTAHTGPLLSTGGRFAWRTSARVSVWRGLFFADLAFDRALDATRRIDGQLTVGIDLGFVATALAFDEQWCRVVD